MYYRVCGAGRAWAETAEGKDLLLRLIGRVVQPVEKPDLVFASPSSITAYWDLRDWIEYGAKRFLLVGERGVGKEGFAQIVAASLRLPFRPVNCASLVESIADAQLFGIAPRSGIANANEKGVPGAVSTQPQLLFLDEFLDAPPTVFPKLLRLLQEGTWYAVGGHEELRLDKSTAIVAASNRVATVTELESHLRDADGVVREDVVDRFDAWLEVPPLRTRTEEIPALINKFAREAAQGQFADGVDSESANSLRDLGYTWPGNIRELRRLINAQARVGRHASPGASLRLDENALRRLLPVRSGASSPVQPSAFTADGIRETRRRELLAELKAAHSEAGRPRVTPKWVAAVLRKRRAWKNVSQSLRDMVGLNCSELVELLVRAGDV